MAHRYGSPGVGERIVAKGLAGRGPKPEQVPELRYSRHEISRSQVC